VVVQVIDPHELEFMYFRNPDTFASDGSADRDGADT